MRLQVWAISVDLVEHGEWLHTFVWPLEITGLQHIDTGRGKCLLTGEPASVYCAHVFGSAGTFTSVDEPSPESGSAGSVTSAAMRSR